MCRLVGTELFHTNLNVCVDVDECATAEHNCDVAADCENMDGYFYCSCKQGYNGDGINCLGKFCITIVTGIINDNMY